MGAKGFESSTSRWKVMLITAKLSLFWQINFQKNKKKKWNLIYTRHRILWIELVYIRLIFKRWKSRKWNKKWYQTEPNDFWAVPYFFKLGKVWKLKIEKSSCSFYYFIIKITALKYTFSNSSLLNWYHTENICILIYKF